MSDLEERIAETFHDWVADNLALDRNPLGLLKPKRWSELDDYSKFAWRRTAKKALGKNPEETAWPTASQIEVRV